MLWELLYFIACILQLCARLLKLLAEHFTLAKSVRVYHILRSLD
jgi:hypothetical protein